MLAHGLVIAFLLAFVGGHLADQRGDAYTRPMSLFRDVEPAWVGYAMFGLLIALGMETARSAARLRYWSQAGVNVLIATALAVTALTPSFDSLHVLGANVAMITLLVNTTWLLFQHEQWFWLVIHITTPATLAMGALANGYGVWQKGMILYFLATTAILNHCFAQCMAQSRREERERAAAARRRMRRKAIAK
ncbi:MAG: hypothetical protein JNL18_24070 [Planctomycetaceae bacterium]|nr:hypothetical protein [Planctomycetaceae bacterium]